MSKFNVNTQGKTRTTNLAGGTAYSESPELELVSILLTSFVQDQYYRSESEGLDRLIKLINDIKDKKFVAQAAIYGRTEFGMRSVSHVAAAELAKIVKGEEWAKRFYDKVVFRVDDITEVLSYYLTKYGKPIPNSLKKGLAKAFLKFDEYQLAKYRGTGKVVSLIDAVNLLHPKPLKKMEKTFKKLMSDELRSTGTWESKVSKAGQEETKEKRKEKKTKAWEDLVKERKIGYFALLRNLRNILESAPDVIDNAIEMLTDKHLIERSKVLPFRYTTAIAEIEKTNFDRSKDILVAINKAVDLSLSNIPDLPGRTLVALDESGSMDGKPFEIGSLFAAVLVKKLNADLLMFSSDGRYLTLNPLDSTLALNQRLKNEFVGGGTNFNAIFNVANKAYDRIIILSDMQAWMDNQARWFGGGFGGSGIPSKSFASYKKGHNAKPKVFSFDLQGYGTIEFPEQGVYALAGFSDKVFDVIKLLDKDRRALIKKIKSIKI